jgi:two-component system response regulator PilR (NtrC family)
MDDLNFLHTQFDDKVSSEELPAIVIVEDDPILCKTIKKFLSKKIKSPIYDYASPQELLDCTEKFKGREFCLVTDISFDENGVDGLILIDLLKERGLRFNSIVMTGFASIETAIMATKKGVFHYLTKPFELEVLSKLILDLLKMKHGINPERVLRQESTAEVLKSSSYINKKFKIESPGENDFFHGMIGRSKVMKQVFERIKKVASTNSTILISGHSGTGKELVAKAVHDLSKRCEERIVSINCGAIPSELLESELFGHVKGSFTGAISDRKGRFELANKGTIFLDEIGDMPFLLQVKLLRVLQSKEIEPVGSSKTVDINTRIITATHRDLEKAVADGNFREDLYYRLNVIPIKVPALCERREDIPLLISFFLSRFVSADGRNKIEFDNDALDILMSHDWPGNVRELENLIERLVILKGGNLVRADDLPAKFLQNRPLDSAFENLVNLPDQGLNLKTIISDIENSLIEQALEKTKGNKNQASKLLQMNRTTLIEKMKKKGLIYT